jgi:hypothetical protein
MENLVLDDQTLANYNIRLYPRILEHSRNLVRNSRNNQNVSSLVVRDIDILPYKKVGKSDFLIWRELTYRLANERLALVDHNLLLSWALKHLPGSTVPLSSPLLAAEVFALESDHRVTCFALYSTSKDRDYVLDGEFYPFWSTSTIRLLCKPNS